MIRAIALTGPTGVGKTALSLQIASHLPCEILSCDSMQIYRGMDIGTAKATAQERAAAVHHMIDICEPSEPFSAADYAARALSIAADVVARGHVPLFVGGTGLYLSTLLRPKQQTPESDPAYHARRMAEAEEMGADALYEQLCRLDAATAATVHKNNVRRVIRALEIYDKTGIPKSVWDESSRQQASEISLCHLTLDAHVRATLYTRTDARVEAMLADGLLDEVRALYTSGRLREGTTASQAIGYKEMLGAVQGVCTVAEATEQLKLSTRHYVKRQLTWFARMEAHRVHIDREDGVLRPFDDVAAEVLAILREEGFAVCAAASNENRNI